MVPAVTECPFNPQFDTSVFDRVTRRRHSDGPLNLPAWRDDKLGNPSTLGPIASVAWRMLSGYTDGRRLLLIFSSPITFSIIAASFGFRTGDVLYLESTRGIASMRGRLVALLPDAVAEADMTALANIASQNGLIISMVVLPEDVDGVRKVKDALLRGIMVSGLYRSPKLSDSAVASAVRRMIYAAMKNPEYWRTLMQYSLGGVFLTGENEGSEAELAELIRLLDGIRMPGGEDTLFTSVVKTVSRYSGSAGTALMNSLGVAASLFVKMNAPVSRLGELLKSMGPDELVRKVVEPVCTFTWHYLSNRSTLMEQSWARWGELYGVKMLVDLVDAMFPGLDTRLVLRNIESGSVSNELLRVMLNLGLVRYKDGRPSLAPIVEWLLDEGW